MLYTLPFLPIAVIVPVRLADRFASVWQSDTRLLELGDARS